MKSLTGNFVIASPGLTDPNFYRSVVLMINHDHEGALGVILNRPLTNPMQEIWEELGVDAENGKSIFLGGPVPGPILVLHSHAELEGGRILDGVYLASQKSQIQEVLARTDSRFRIVVGYSGWAAGQLENELRAGGWLTHPADSTQVFSDRDDLWEYLIRCVGESILAPSIKRLQCPDDPRLN